MHTNQEAGALDTLVVHAGERRPGPEGSLVFPIYQGTVYSVEPGTDYHEIKYIRLNSTPSQQYLHDKLAALEGAERRWRQRQAWLRSRPPCWDS
jgi:cystathionine beta-lyase/cystathionine gamma-synthase